MVAIADGKPQQMGLLDIIRTTSPISAKWCCAARSSIWPGEGALPYPRRADHRGAQHRRGHQIIKTSESVPVARQRLRERFDPLRAAGTGDPRSAARAPHKAGNLQARTGTRRAEKAHRPPHRHRREQEIADGGGQGRAARAQKTVQERAQERLVFDAPRSRWKNSTTCARRKVRAGLHRRTRSRSCRKELQYVG